MHPLFALGLPHGLEWLWIALIVVLLFGADKLPKLARGLGKSLGEFKKAKDEFEREIHSSVAADDAKALEQKSGVTITPAPTATPVSSTPAGDEPSKKI
jgi:TatA/E family protein of Tat protein translocase